MSLVNGNYQFNIDARIYCEEHPDCTYGDVFQDVVLPAFQNWYPECEYITVDNNKYPAIKLPWSDGTIGENIFATFHYYKSVSEVVGTGSSSFYFGINGQGTTMGLNCCRNTDSFGGGGGATSWAIKNVVLIVRIYVENGAIHLGAYPTNNNANINTFIHLTKIRDTNNNYQNCMIYGTGTGNVSSPSNGMRYSILYEDHNTDIIYPNSMTRLRAGVGQVIPIDIGDWKHEDWFVYWMGNTSMKGEWDNKTDLLIDPLYAEKVWYLDAFTIGGQSYDAFILGTTNSSSSYGVNICRKHIDE